VLASVLVVSLLATLSQRLAAAQRATPPPDPIPAALETMVDAERAFAKRALEVGWKQAFLEFFSDSAIGYDGEDVGLAKNRSKRPRPARDHNVGRIPATATCRAAGTGLPHRTFAQHRPRNSGQPRRGLRLGMERERDSTFRGCRHRRRPRAATFAEHFTRAERQRPPRPSRPHAPQHR
jgi:hypothetical protein